MTPGEPILAFSGISKSYFGNRVLHEVDLALASGEIHALVGENGAGKSTLMNVLFGMPVIRETGGYEGRIELGGREIAFTSPHEAMAAGIGMVHQEFMLLPGLSVAENVKLNREPLIRNPFGRMTKGRLDLVDFPTLGRGARRSLDRVGLDVDEWARVEGLPVSHLQFIEIAREIDKERSRVLVFDEPTAVLTEEEAGRLLEVIRKLADDGIGILFITHRLDEVVRLADTVTVLRDGRVVRSMPAIEATPAGLAELMVGREVERIRSRGEDGTAGAGEGPEVVATIRDLEVDMPGENVRGIDLDLHRGEILGIGGLAGHGKIGIANGLMGLHPARGEVRIDGEILRLGDAGEAIRRGLAFVSEDRRGVGLLLDTAIEVNIAATAAARGLEFLAGPPLLGVFRRIRRADVRANALELIEALDIRCTGPGQPVRRLSGGNQQKVCLARAMTLDPRILLVSEPTRGIDVGAKTRILDLLEKLAAEGMTILMTSSELAELRSISDRIVLIYRGRIAGILPPDASDREVGLTMAGEAHLLSEES